ncbi:MAG: GAF domain-containing protein, partial [Thermodesulfobacteriota bacterium]|nr:GAF domain-containing protein [Thermodesulfobacteriota bacterium]
MVSNPDSPGKPKGPADAGDSARDRLARLEAQLETYKKTLTGIYELYDEKIEELSFIRRISDSLRTPLDLEALCLEVVDAVAQEIAVDRLALMLVDQDRENLLVKASFDAGLDETRFHSGHETKVLPLDQGAAGRAVQTGRPVLLDSGRDDQDPLGHASA